MTEVRSRVVRALKLAETTGDAAWLRFAVVGGGQAGVELAGEIADVVGARRTAVRDLVERGVDVWVGATVVDVDDEGLEIGGALRMPARTVMWAPAHPA